MADFKKGFVEDQKKLLLGAKAQILNKIKESGMQELHINPDDQFEVGDQAQAYLDQNLNISLRERDFSRLREIEMALEKIENGSYGYCEESGDPIEMKRLQKYPWARFSLESAELMEKERGNVRRFAR